MTNSHTQDLRAFVSESCTKRYHKQSLTVFGGVNSQYTSVRRLGNSRLSEALISEKWHDWKCEIFTTAGSSNTEIRGFCAVVEVLLNSIKGNVRHVVFWGQHLMDYANVVLRLKCLYDSKEWVLQNLWELCVFLLQLWFYYLTII